METFTEKLAKAGLLKAPPGSSFTERAKLAGLDVPTSVGVPARDTQGGPTFRDKLVSAAGSFAQGASQSVVGGLKGLARTPIGSAIAASENVLSEAISPDGGTPQPIEKQDIVGALQGVSTGVAEALPRDPRLEGSFLVDTLPGAAGSLTGFALGGAAARKVGFSATAASTLIGAFSNADAKIEEAQQAGRSESDIFNAGLAGFATGSTEGLPIGLAFKRLDNLTGGSVKRLIGKALAGGLEEAGQEFIQNIADNKAAQKFIDENRGLLEGVSDQTAAGGILGFALNLVVGSVGLRRARLKQAPVVPQSPAESTSPPKGSPNTLVLPDGEKSDLGVLPPTLQVTASERPEVTPAAVGAEQDGNDALPPSPKVIGQGKRRSARGGPFGLWSKPLTDVVAPQAGIVGEVAADMSRKSSDETNRILGIWATKQHELAGMVSGRFHRKRTLEFRHAISEINTRKPSPDGLSSETVFQQASEDLGFDPTADVSPEGGHEFDSLSPAAKEIITKFREFTLFQGQTAEAMKVNIEFTDPVTGKRVRGPFHPQPQGAKFMRAFATEYFDILRAGDKDPAFGRLAETLASYPQNNLDAPAALRALKEVASRPITKASSVELSRTFVKFPAWLRGDGEDIPLIHSHPMDVVMRGSERLAMRLGFISQFGQNENGQIQAFKEAFEMNGGNAADFDRMLRGLQGIPVHDPVLPQEVRPGTRLHKYLRVGRAGLGVNKVLQLTQAFAVNMTEIFGKIPAFGGGRRFLIGVPKALFKDATMAMTRLLTQGPEGVASYRIETMRMGQRSSEIADWTINRARLPESGVRILGNILNFPLRAANEFNEFYAAVDGSLMARDLAAGNGSIFDRQRLKGLLKFSPQDIETLMSGTADPKLYQAVASRMAERTQGANSRPAQRSFIGTSRIAREVVVFDSFAQMTANRTALIYAALKAEAQDAFKQGRLTKELGAQIAITAEYMGGIAVQGALGIYLLGFIKDGISGVKEADKDRREDLVAFVEDGIRNALISGYAATADRAIFGDRRLDPSLQDVRSSRDVIDQFSGAIYPISVIGDIVDMVRGRGAYRNTTGSISKASEFLMKNTAIASSLSQWAGIMGITGKDTNMDLARRRFWGWMRRNTPRAAISRQTEFKSSMQFRRQMRQVGDMITSGADSLDINARLIEILHGTDGARSAKASLRGQKLLPKIPTQNGLRLRFLKEFSPELLAKIRQHDGLLEKWAADPRVP